MSEIEKYIMDMKRARKHKDSFSLVLSIMSTMKEDGYGLDDIVDAIAASLEERKAPRE